MLTLQGVSVGYGDRLAVDTVDLTVADGEVLALLGPSGCGKSTLLRAVAGLEPVRAGTIAWDGRDLSRVPVHRRGFGLMFQDGVLFGHRSVSGNVAYGLQRHGFSRGQITARVDELLGLVGLDGYGRRGVATLSGGEQQRVALARALAPSPRLVLLDEPLAALDRALRDRLLPDLTAVLQITGTAALFVTHDQGEAFAVADRVAVMRAGQLVQSAPPQQLWQHPVDAITARFLGYTAVLPVGAADQLFGSSASGSVVGQGDCLALRPSALRWDPTGRIVARVLRVLPTPDGLRLRVAVDGAGELDAVADLPSGPNPGPATGSTIRLRFDSAGAARLSG